MVKQKRLELQKEGVYLEAWRRESLAGMPLMIGGGGSLDSPSLPLPTNPFWWLPWASLLKVMWHWEPEKGIFCECLPCDAEQKKSEEWLWRQTGMGHCLLPPRFFFFFFFWPPSYSTVTLSISNSPTRATEVSIFNWPQKSWLAMQGPMRGKMTSYLITQLWRPTCRCKRLETPAMSP